MGFDGEFAHYEPLRKIFSSEKVKYFTDNLYVNKNLGNSNDIPKVAKNDLPKTNNVQPDLILAIDGSMVEGKVAKGFPGATLGYVVIASVLMDLKKIRALREERFPDPQKVYQTETSSSLELVFPGCNVFQQEDECPKEYLRRQVYEELENARAFPDGGESLLETYEHLLDLRSSQKPPKCPIEGYEHEDLIIRKGISRHQETDKPLYSTDALRLHELMNATGSNISMFNTIMSVFEKLWFVNILRSFEKMGWLGTLRNVAFVLDGPLAVFSTPAWLAACISKELMRINTLQKKITGQDIIVFGIEKSGQFCDHFAELDVDKKGVEGVFPKETAGLLDNTYIKKNITLVDTPTQYGDRTNFGRKFFYKTASGSRFVCVDASFSEAEKDLSTADVWQFSRLRDIMVLLDQLVSCRYPNSITPLISAHAEAAIPYKMMNVLFKDIARKIVEGSE